MRKSTPQPVGVSEGLLDHHDRVKRIVYRLIDLSHTTLTERSNYAITALQDSVATQHRCGIRIRYPGFVRSPGLKTHCRPKSLRTFAEELERGGGSEETTLLRYQAVPCYWEPRPIAILGAVPLECREIVFSTLRCVKAQHGRVQIV